MYCEENVFSIIILHDFTCTVNKKSLNLQLNYYTDTLNEFYSRTVVIDQNIKRGIVTLIDRSAVQESERLQSEANDLVH